MQIQLAQELQTAINAIGVHGVIVNAKEAATSVKQNGEAVVTVATEAGHKRVLLRRQFVAQVLGE